MTKPSERSRGQHKAYTLVYFLVALAMNVRIKADTINHIYLMLNSQYNKKISHILQLYMHRRSISMGLLAFSFLISTLTCPFIYSNQ